MCLVTCTTLTARAVVASTSGTEITAVAVAGAVTALCAVLTATGAFGGLRLRASDAVTFPRGEVAPEVVVVAVDSASVAAQAQAWPWSRDRQATLVEAITAAGARTVVLDVVLAPASSGDDRLADALAAVPSVIGAAVESTTDQDRQWTTADVLLASSLIEPEAVFRDAATLVGHTAVTPDAEDGVTRTVPLVVEWNRRFRPSLALAALAVHAGIGDQLTVRPGAVQIGGRSIPTDARHQLRVSYTDALSDNDATHVVPAADVIAGRAGERLRDKVVFVGVTDPIAGDRVLTPIAKRSGTAGVFVQANAYNTMANRTYLSAASTGETTMWVLLLSLAVAIATLSVRLWVGVVAAAASIVGYLFFAVARADRGSVLEVVVPVIGVLLAVLSSAGARELLVDRQRRRIAALFGQYVPPRVAKELVGEQRASGLLDGRRLDATVVFCDIRGFTPLTSSLAASQVRDLLDTYYSVLSDVVLAHEGTVISYTGDEILAAFGAPLETDDHPSRAVRCAIAMQEAHPRVVARMRERGFDAFGYGIGVQTGEVVSAVMGTEIRRQYNVIGTTLTLGARLCAQAGPGEVVIASETWERLDERPDAEEFVAELKGRAEPAHLHRVRMG